MKGEVKSVGQVGEMRGSLGLVAEVNPNFSCLVLLVLLVLVHYCSALTLTRLLILDPYFKSGSTSPYWRKSRAFCRQPRSGADRDDINHMGNPC